MIDLQAIFLSVWLPLLLWVLMVGGATLSGYPGVICITPLGWLLALSVGLRLPGFSSTKNPTLRLAEAGMGGAFLGFFQGFLFAVILALYPSLRSQGEGLLDAILTGLIALATVGGVSALVDGALALAIAAFVERRRPVSTR